MLRPFDHDPTGLRSKCRDEFARPGAPSLDFVFTVSDRAAPEGRPVCPGRPLKAHRGVEDPVVFEGTEQQKLAFLRRIYGYLENRIKILVSLPIASLDRLTLQKRLEEIGSSVPPAEGRRWPPDKDRKRRLLAELPGTRTLVAAVNGSATMAERSAGGNAAPALGDTLPTGAILTVPIVILGPVSGAPVNPAVSLAMALRRALPPSEARPSTAAPMLAGVAGASTAHLVLDLPLVQFAGTPRTGLGQ